MQSKIKERYNVLVATPHGGKYEDIYFVVNGVSFFLYEDANGITICKENSPKKRVETFDDVVKFVT